MEQFKQLDFSGQTIFVGIDVHKKSWRVSLRSQHVELKTFSQNPSAGELCSHLKREYPRADYRLVYEAGFCGFHFQRAFERAGISCIIVNPADIPTSDKDRRRKSDTIDCRKLSRTLSEGNLKGIFVPSVEQQDDRGIVRAYNQMVKNQTRCKNQIKGLLNFQGIDSPFAVNGGHWPNNYLTWLAELPLGPSARINLDILLENYRNSRSMVLACTRQLRLLASGERNRETISLLRTIPGVGLVTSVLLALEIGDVNRFGSFDQLCSFVGLVPNVSGSGDSEHVLGLTNRAHHQLREKLIEASWIAVRRDPAITMAFGEYAKRMNKNRAIIKVARKMIARIRFVLKNRAAYVTAVVK